MGQSSELSSPKIEEAGIQPDSDNSVIKEKVTKKWQSYIWDTFDKSPEERRFLFKLDAALLTFASLGNDTAIVSTRKAAKALTVQLGYFIKYLDQTNINNAFVSGMYVQLIWRYLFDS